ncbi:MAG: hypothetical protein RL421_1182, partial [Actinomycetota bacterium]
MAVVVAGYTGLVGSAIFAELRNRNIEAIGINSKVVNLLDRKSTFDFLQDLKPEAVIDAA